MRWLLAGCCVLGLINLSVALELITQKPRFLGVTTGRTVWIYCSLKQPRPVTMHWSKADAPNTNGEELKGERIEFRDRNLTKNAYLVIRNAKVEDSGVYFCKMNHILGPGTQLLVVKHADFVQAQYRTAMKDGLIILQGLLLALCISVILLRRQTLSKKKDTIYEEPETDHIYQGLTIEPHGGGLYEELSVYAQADGAEAPWE